MNREGAEEKAKKLAADGESFYGISEQELRQEFGHSEGRFVEPDKQVNMAT